MKLFKFWPWSVLILGAYPVIYTYSVNLGAIDGSIILTPLLAAIAAAVLLNLFCAIGMRSLARGALVTDFILFSTYLSTSLIETLFPWIYSSPLNKPVASAIIIAILAGAWRIGRRIS